MNEMMEGIRERRSIRKYKADMLPKETIQKIIEAGLYAPSANGEQKSIIIAVTEPELRNELSEMNRKIAGWKEGVDPFYGAPVVLVVLVAKTGYAPVYDGSLVMGNLMLAAHSLGIGSCWIHRAKEEFETERGKEILKELGIIGEYEGVGHCILGLPDEKNLKASERKAGRVYFVE